MKQQIGRNFEKVIKELENRGNKVTKLSSDIGYTSTTYMHKTFDGESLLSTKAIINLIEKFNVRPDFIFLGKEPMFIGDISEDAQRAKLQAEMIEQEKQLVVDENLALKKKEEEMRQRILDLEENNKGLITLSNKIASAFGGKDTGKDKHPHSKNFE